MSPSRPITLTAILTSVLLAGCGTNETQAPTADTTSETTAATSEATDAAAAGEVPEGVAAQYATLTEEVEAEGGRTTSGDWEVAYIVELAEPWFETTDGEPTRREPAEGETHHLEIIPIEAATGRIVPEVPIRLEVLDDTGEVVDEQELMFFNAEFFHYANNFSIPAEDDYTLRATLQPPEFTRHGESLEELTLLEPVTVTFEDVHLEPAPWGRDRSRGTGESARLEENWRSCRAGPGRIQAAWSHHRPPRWIHQQSSHRWDGSLPW